MNKRPSAGNADRSTMRRAARTRKAEIILPVLAPVLALVLVAACGGGAAESTLSPEAEAGRLTAQGLGCAACHGLEGQGIEQLGPPWQGLFDSDVTLVDGTVVKADLEYLRRSIIDPDADLVAGFTLPMPPYRLEPGQLESLLDYLVEVG